MVTVYQYIPAWNMLDISPFCVKLIAYLKMAQVPHCCAVGNPLLAPKGKLPYIIDGENTISDSSLIIDYLIDKYGNPLDADISPAEQAQSTAFQSLFEEHLYFVLLCDRWQSPTSWATYRPILSAYGRALGFPGPLLPLFLWQARRTVRGQIRAQGTGRFSDEERARIARRLIDAVAVQLGDRPFLLGDRPRRIDATAFAFVSGILDPPIASATQQHARQLPALSAYRDRMRERYGLLA